MEPGKALTTPNLQSLQVEEIVKSRYGLAVKRLDKLDGYDDKNYHVEIEPEVQNPFINCVWPHGYVLKIMNALDSKHETSVRVQHALAKYLSENGIVVQLPEKNVEGETYTVMKLNDNGHIVRLMTYIPGTVLANTKPSNDKLRNIGAFVGRLALLLKNFKTEVNDKRDSIWFFTNVLRLKSYLHHIEDQNKVEMIHKTLEEFETKVLPVTNELERVLTHGDINENNLVMCGNEVAGLLDFGDTHYSVLILDLAICICYMLLYAKEIEAGKPIIEGYLRFRAIGKEEKSILKSSICARLCQSLVLGIYSHKQDPTNEYILSSQKAGWDILTKLQASTNEELLSLWGLN